MRCDRCNGPCYTDEYLGELHYVCLIHGTVWIAAKGEQVAADFVPIRTAPRRVYDTIPTRYHMR